MRVVDPIGPDGERASRDRCVLTDVSGEPAVDLGLAPPLSVRLTARRMRARPPQCERERLAAIARAGELFAGAEIDGESPADYCHDHARLSGVPVAAAVRALSVFRDAAARVEEVVRAQRPPDLSGCAWTRRGDVLGVLAPGNHPLPHALWLTAIALGWRVAVRPSTRDPLTAARLAKSLHLAGLDPGYCALLPGVHESGDALLSATDLGLVFGSRDTVARHAGDPRVRAFGPGNSKILVTADVDWREHLDVLVASIGGEGGTQCLHATVVLVEDEADEVAEALAEALARHPVRPPEHPDATLPVASLASAVRITDAFTAHTGIPCAPAEIGDGSAALRPVVIAPRDTTARPVEMPFPCAWVRPWRPEDGIGPLRDSLALTLLTRRRDVVARCVEEPTIRAVHWGPTPTTTFDPLRPHDGHLAEFLMTTKTASGWA
ncbi:aldehyde dehydrogenase family protein [Saccharothrix obliqua]|uniref:aldehyde dehydrogenase family protein n=1 Tax=Saccharothrix obliqua TaxID=2861747 RepID=UPI001C6011C9|nr:aldehyde dehydrogenase family protein [Saccharothrix obliqua]MBW4720315.1 aldehyde dehydrogenase family protein [Saccharothrix obliqua]